MKYKLKLQEMLVSSENEYTLEQILSKFEPVEDPESLVLKSPTQVYSSCQHQWFEIKKISKYSERMTKLLEVEEKRKEKWNKEYPGEIDPERGFFLSDIRGVLVKCANCKSEQKLWESENV